MAYRWRKTTRVFTVHGAKQFKEIVVGTRFREGTTQRWHCAKKMRLTGFVEVYSCEGDVRLG